VQYAGTVALMLGVIAPAAELYVVPATQLHAPP